MDAAPKICFYGDDVTGSTDAMANFARWGLDTRLVFDAAAIAGLPGEPDVVGVAGKSRSLPSSEIAGELLPVLNVFASLCPEFVQYKVCSTFDSSPEVGSIGRACEVASDRFGRRAIPVLAAQPDLGRWTLFSNHFARASDGRVYRLDRHPTMSAHPVTPMQEADLRELLKRQTAELPVCGVHFPDLASYPDLAGSHPGPIVLDGAQNADLRLAGQLLRSGERTVPLFAVGSGGLSYALGSAFKVREVQPEPVGEAGPVLAVSGSCSPDTARQIRNAVEAGWRAIDLKVDGAEKAGLIARRSLAEGRSVVVYSALGAPKPAETASHIGLQLGKVAELAIEGCRRLLVAGGDTAGDVMRVIGGTELSYAGLVGGRQGTCTLCLLRTSSQSLRRLQVVLKGGQIGGPGFFEEVRLGTRPY